MFFMFNFSLGSFLLSDGELGKFSFLVLLRPHLSIIYVYDVDIDAKDADDDANNDDDITDDDENNNDGGKQR